MMSKVLLETLYESATLQRWNDHIRPHKGFTELDKQGHKVAYAYIIGRIEEIDRGIKLEWQNLIEGAIFEFLHRLILTDIKPPIFHKLMQRKQEELNRWVLAQLQESLKGLPRVFRDNFEYYLFDPSYSKREKKILHAAHYLATDWEFKIIYPLNGDLYGLNHTKASIGNELEEHYDLAGVQKISLGKKTNNLMDLIGQLRFQQRWSQTLRMPETSVLGHMLIVAMLAYFSSLQVQACSKRRFNNFFAGLFHDLPEVLTRDIVAPVKRSVQDLEEIIKEIEHIEIQEKLLPLIPRVMHEEIQFFIADEFDSKIVRDHAIVKTSSHEINLHYNLDDYNPLDGEIIRACDHLAAYIEAVLSLDYGIRSRHLEDAVQNLYKQYKNKNIAGIDFGHYFDYFIPGDR